jgi:Fe-S-cluster containining protein
MRNATPPPRDAEPTGEQDLPAGAFSAWLRLTRSALINGTDVAVPCGECTACCRSSYFIHIRPDEIATLKRIDKKLLFPAPGLPKGNVVLGYDQHGHCPMLVNNACSIYAQRPHTCRAYDCRIFIAAGIAAGEDDKGLINQRIQRWQFSYPSQRDRDEHAAVQAAARFLQAHAAAFPDGVVPRNPPQLAIFAIKVYEVFLTANPSATPDDANIQAILAANEEFEARQTM